MRARVGRAAGHMAVAGAMILGWVAVQACGTKPPAPTPPAARPQAAATAGVQGTARRNPPADHLKDRKGVRHKSGSKQALQNCGPCHGQDLRGGAGPSCYACHGKEWK